MYRLRWSRRLRLLQSRKQSSKGAFELVKSSKDQERLSSADAKIERAVVKIENDMRKLQEGGSLISMITRYGR